MAGQTKQPKMTPGTSLQELDNFMNDHSGFWDREEGGKIKQKLGRGARHGGVSVTGWMGLKPLC